MQEPLRLYQINLTLPNHMEPSSIDDLRVELFRLLRASRREESFVPLTILAQLIAENLEAGEHLLLANQLMEYEHTRLAAEVTA